MKKFTSFALIVQSCANSNQICLMEDIDEDLIVNALIELSDLGIQCCMTCEVWYENDSDEENE